MNTLLIRTCSNRKSSRRLRTVSCMAVVAAGRADTLEILWASGAAAVTPTRKMMRTNSVFDVASVTKVVATASACAVCIDRGLLDPIAPVSEYLPKSGSYRAASSGFAIWQPIARATIIASLIICDPEQLVDKVIEARRSGRPANALNIPVAILLSWGAHRAHHRGESGGVLPPQRVCPARHDADRLLRRFRWNRISSFRHRNQPAWFPMSRPKSWPAVGNAGLFSSAGTSHYFVRCLLRGGGAGRRASWAPRTCLAMQPCSPVGLPRRSFGWDMRPCPECPYRPPDCRSRQLAMVAGQVSRCGLTRSWGYMSLSHESDPLSK